MRLSVRSDEPEHSDVRLTEHAGQECSAKQTVLDRRARGPDDSPVPEINFTERRYGRFQPIERPREEWAMSVCVSATLCRWALPWQVTTWDLEGEVYIEGLAAHRMLLGTLRGDLLRGRLYYAFRFQDDQFRACQFRGEIVMSRAKGLLRSFGALSGTVLDRDDHPLGKALLRFDAKSELVPWIRSFGLSLR